VALLFVLVTLLARLRAPDAEGGKASAASPAVQAG